MNVKSKHLMNNKKKFISQNLRKFKLLSFFQSTVFLCLAVICISILLMVVVSLCFENNTIAYDVGNGFLISAVSSAVVSLILEYKNSIERKKRRYAVLMNPAISIERFIKQYDSFQNNKPNNIAEEVKEMAAMLALPMQCIRECANNNSNDLDLFEIKQIQTINYLSRFSLDLLDHSMLYELNETEIRSKFVKEKNSAFSIESYCSYLSQISDAFVILFTKWKCEGVIPGGNESAS